MPQYIRLTIIFLISSQHSLMAQLSTMTDPRDGKIYKTVRIGNQTWMAQNLAYAANLAYTFDNKWPSDLENPVTNNGKEYSEDNYENFAFCYKDSIKNLDRYGAFYPWEAALKACPSGWHLPSRAEVDTLLANSGRSRKDAYVKLITGGASGYDAILAGSLWSYYSVRPLFKRFNHGAIFWTSTVEPETSRHVKRIQYFAFVKAFHRVMIYSTRGQLSGAHSVRCLLDAP